MTFKELYNRIPYWKRISLSKVYQNPKWHPEIWVDKHIEQVFNNVITFHGYDIDLLICAIFHDIAKDEKWQKVLKPKNKNELHLPKVWQMYYLKVSHLDHEMAALPYIEKWKHLYSELNINWEKVYVVCKYHLRAHQYKNGELKKKHKRIKFECLKYFDDIMKFEICDSYNPLKELNVLVKSKQIFKIKDKNYHYVFNIYNELKESQDYNKVNSELIIELNRISELLDDYDMECNIEQNFITNLASKSVNLDNDIVEMVNNNEKLLLKI